MNSTNRKVFVRISSTALVAAIGLGGLGFQHSAVRAAEPAVSSQAQESIAYLNDPLRLELARIAAKQDQVFSITGSYIYDPDSYQYYDLIAAEKQAYVAAIDPNSSSALLSETAQNYEQKLNAYMDRYLGKQNVTRDLANWYHVLYYLRAHEDVNSLNPYDRALFQAVLDTQAYWKNTNAATDQEHVDGFKIFLNTVARLGDTKSYDAQAYLQKAASYRANIQSLLANSNGGAAGHEASLSLFERSASLLEQASSAGYNYNVVNLLENNLESRYVELEKELREDGPPLATEEKFYLQNMIKYSWTLMEFPAGIRSGETPQSAFGDLRRAIRKAESVYEKGTTWSEFNSARKELEQANRAFFMRRKP
ncbi:hypothetical protein [Saccharibacillus deserti]|uniref:hypothetical protein n=1 Tax=Saccharibacillus deserti TaxID=1634444 RepID=UPI001554E5F5|nr:hypothetical protein [Saccharibacillus deserti]